MKNLIFTSIFSLIIAEATAASYFEQEKEMAKSSLSQKNTSAKMALRETEASIIKKVQNVNFVIYRTAFQEEGDLFIGGIKASPLHSFTSDYNFALVIDRDRKLPLVENSDFYQLLSNSQYRSYQFIQLNEQKELSKFPLTLPKNSELNLMIFSSHEGDDEIFPQVFRLSQCGEELKAKQSSDRVRSYYYQENGKCPLLYTFVKGDKLKNDVVFFSMLNNAPAVVQEQIERSRDVIDRYQRLLRSELKKAEPNKKIVTEYNQKIAEQKLQLKQLKAFHVNVSE